MHASVKVMRSYDYCHFEMALTREVPDGDLDAVNDLRKEAAILVDEAVRQYRVAKAKESSRDTKQFQAERFLERIKAIEQKPASERTVEDAAALRVKADADFWQSYREDDFYYQEDEEREYHFSMLRRFKDFKVAAAAQSR